MSRQRRQSQKSKGEQVEVVVRALSAGKTQGQAAIAAGVTTRTVQRWVADPQVKQRLTEIQEQTDAIIKTDPVVLSVAEIRQQVQNLADYRDSQKRFAAEMGEVVSTSVQVLKVAVQRLQANPEELPARAIPPLLKAVTDAAEKVSNAWARSSSLDNLLERIDDSQADSQV